MDFKLGEEQLMLRQTVRDFAQNVVKPKSLELDAKKDPKECVPWELVKQASKLGLRTAFVPQKYGGGGLDCISRVLMLEELGKSDSGFAYLILMTNLGFELFFANARKEIIDEFAEKIIKDDAFLFATGTTEPDHGSDIHLLYDAPEVLKTFAQKKGDSYVLNGRKLWISNGGIAKLYCINARTKRGVPLSVGMTSFIVPADTPGFSSGKISDKLGCRLETNAELIFEDAQIPSRYALTEENKGWPFRERALDMVVNYKSPILVGLLQGIYDTTLEYAKTRIQGGKPIIEHPTVAVMLGEMKVQIEAARLIVYQNAWSMDNQQYDPKWGWLGKAFVNRMAVKITADALEIHGAVGHEKGMFMEKFLRDVYSQLHGFGLPTIALLKGRPTL